MGVAPACSPCPLQQRIHGAAQVEADLCDEGQDVAAREGAGRPHCTGSCRAEEGPKCEGRGRAGGEGVTSQNSFPLGSKSQESSPLLL